MEGLSSEVEGDIRSTKNTDKQIQWRRAKVLELSSQGNTQSIASFPLLDGFKLQDFLFYSITISVIVDLIVSIVLICRVMVCFIQLRIFMVANKNAIKQVPGTYHKRHKTTKKKYKPLNTIWNVISNYGLCCMEEKATWLDLVNPFHNNSINIKRMNLLLQKVSLSPPITVTEIRFEVCHQEHRVANYTAAEIRRKNRGHGIKSKSC